MLTVQACQQHQLAVMRPNKAKSFPAATVPALARLGYRRRGKRGTRSEERTNARRAHVSTQKCRRWRSRGVVGVPHPTRRKQPTRRTPHSNPRKAVKMAGTNLRKVHKAAVLSFFWDFVRKLETHTREGDQAGFYKHLKTMNLERKRDAAWRTSKTRTAYS